MAHTPNQSVTSSSTEIPQFVVIRDLVHNTYKHPTIHYVFEDEPFPDVPRDKLIVVDLDQNAQFSSAESYSPHFQVTDCRLQQSTISDQLDDHSSTGLLTVEGVSAPKANEAIESLQPIRNLDNLRETIYNFKMRNEMVKSVFSANASSSSPPPPMTSSSASIEQ